MGEPKVIELHQRLERVHLPGEVSDDRFLQESLVATRIGGHAVQLASEQVYMDRLRECTPPLKSEDVYSVGTYALRLAS